jgi:L-lactate dehydrogenase complex protein LldG
MQYIADRLGRARITEQPQHPFRGVPDFWREYNLEQEERIGMFMNNWTALGGHAFRMKSLEEVGRFLQEFAQETGAQKLLMQRQPELLRLGLQEALRDVECTVWDSAKGDMIDEAAQADIGIVVVDHAAAYTGTLVVLSSPDKGRSTSLLPRALVAIVPAHVIEANLGPILKDLDARPKEQLPAGVHFITGPSRSSDIENDLTIGVHGPGIVYALVVG